MNATDVLKQAVEMSKGDTTLKSKTRFRSFKRAERKFILESLQKCNNIPEDMLQHRDMWVKLGERLHPGDYYKLDTVNAAFKIIRENAPYPTFNSSLEKFSQGDFSKLVPLLRRKPEILAKRLAHLLRISRDRTILRAFEEICDKIPTLGILNLYNHFTYVINYSSRIFFPKNSTVKAIGVKNTLPEIPLSVSVSVTDICRDVLLKRFSTLPHLGKCYIDPELANYAIPFKNLPENTLTRGSKLDFKGDYVSVWCECDQKIQLNAMLYDSNWKYIEHLPTASTSTYCWADIDVPANRSSGRYISFNVFADNRMENCEVNFCTTVYKNHNEFTDTKFRILNNTSNCCIMFLDLLDKKIIWADASGNLNTRNTAALGKYLTILEKPNLYDLLTFHAESRGYITTLQDVADHTFDSKITNNFGKIYSEFIDIRELSNV